MGLVKVVKNKAYFKRYQVKFRRRREGKTDYYARKKLIWQDKNKYATPKYRLVVRFTNKNVLAQVVYSRMDGDKILCAAESRELPRYGLKVGLTNYSASYCTGLLLARRVLKQLKMDETFQGSTEVTGKKPEEETDGSSPFTCYLDVGLKRTTTGSNIFGVLKGAVDGGVNVPYKEKRFFGFDAKKEKGKEYDAAAHANRILGGHVSSYMSDLEKDSPETYQARFSAYINAGLTPDGLEDMYRNVHKAIREKPDRVKKTAKTYEVKKRWNRVKLNLKQRKDRVKQLKQNFSEKIKAEMADD